MTTEDGWENQKVDKNMKVSFKQVLTNWLGWKRVANI
jgi:hypothetical protein